MYNREKQREYSRRWRERNPEKLKEVDREAHIRYIKNYPERKAAQMAVYYAVKVGKLKRKPCEICGATPAEGHHYLGYDKENHLDVIWLCRKHHKRYHYNVLRT